MDRADGASFILDAPMVHERFSALSSSAPSRLALVGSGFRLSYGELASVSNGVAVALARLGAGREARVALVFGRTPLAIVAMLGALKAGAAYVPLDPDAPAERNAAMIADAGASVLVCEDGDRRADALAPGLPRLRLDPASLPSAAEAPQVEAHPDQLAYVVFTSGSTGRPKGVGVAHGPLAMHAREVGALYGANPDDVVLHVISFSFDGATECWLAALAHGGRLVVADPKSLAPADLLALVRREGVTIVGMTPALLMSLVEAQDGEGGGPLPVRSWTAGGEAFALKDFARLRAAFPSARIINGYGPTEAVITPTLFAAAPDAPAARYASPAGEAGFVPIGTPVGARAAHVLDEDMNEVGVGVAGELHLGGYGLARGYLGRPGETALRFVPDPFGPRGARLYRTGDRVRRREDGGLDYLGRLDRQAKIRGFRIEPGEVEAQLVADPLCREAAAVVARRAGAPQLVAYVAPARTPEAQALDAATLASRLRTRLEARLPDYMRPSLIEVLPALPRLPNGKIDRLALPEPAWPHTAYEPPRTETERALAAIWESLLDARPIGRAQSFLELGGNSITAIKMTAGIRRRFDATIGLEEVFATPTLAELAAAIERAADAATALDDVDALLAQWEAWDMTQSMRRERSDWEGIARRVAALPADRRAPFLQATQAHGVSLDELPFVPIDAPDGMSPAQRRLWFLWRLEPQSEAYVVGGALALEGALDEAALQRALDWLSARHEALRTIFAPQDDGDARPLVLPPAALALERADAPDAETQAREIAKARVRRPFDLTAGPLLRAGLVRVAPSRHLLWLAVHHIVCDGWSMATMVEELAAAYGAFAQGESPTLPAPPIRYADYAAWQRLRAEAGEATRQLDWWKGELGQARPPLALPTDRPRPPIQSFRGALHAFTLDAELSRRARDFSRSRGASLFMTLLAAYHALLARLSGEDDISVGVSNANRARPETAGLVGFFVTTQVIRARPRGETSFDALLTSVKATTLKAQTRQDVAFEALVEALAPERSLSCNPLFQAKFTQQIALPEAIEAAGLVFSPALSADEAARFDLSLDFVDRGETIEAAFAYAADLFDAPTVARFAELYADFLDHALARPQAPLREFSPKRASRLAGEARVFPHRDVLSTFAASVAASPEAVALTDGAATLTCAELDARSSRLAAALRTRGVGRESVVALLGGRSAGFVTGLLAIMKAGGAYAPLDPRQPEKRLRALIAQSGAKLVLSDRRDARFGALAVDDLLADAPEPPSAWPAPHPRQAAYLIFTSGSTGEPKGVVVPHHALANYVAGALGRLAPPADCGLGMASTIAADLGHTVLYGALCSGRTLHLIDEDAILDADRFADVVAARRIGALKLAPSHLQGLLATPRAAEVLPACALILGGEALPPALVEAARALKPGLRVVNHYGPTETTVGALTHEPAGLPAHGSVPIGRPLPNVDVMLLDADLNPVPPGSTGELHIGGDALARGYLGRPGATAERFVPDPFRPGARLYRTGDFGRLDAQGNVVFIGRRDDQVKIRGHRVELREVAQTLRSLPGVDAAEVIFERAQSGRERLVAYVVAPAAEASAIEAQARAMLPAHMVPAAFVKLERMPVTANGKLDRARLPAPEAVAAKAPENPAGEIERVLAGVWGDVLRRQDFSPDDNFFALGGDSILTLQVVARAKRAGVRITPKQLFETQTVRALARLATPAAPQAPTPGPKPTVEIPLTPAAAEFFARPVGARSHWNQSVLLVPSSPLKPEALTQALAALAATHDALRLRFALKDGRWLQRRVEVQGATDLLRVITVADEAALSRACEETQRSLDIENGPPLRALLAVFPDGRQRLMMTIHHLYVDGVSWRILLDDLELALTQIAQGREPRLPPVETSFGDYAQKLFLRAHSQALRDELPHWRALAGVEPEHAPRPLTQARRLSRSLDAALTRRLDEAATREGGRLHETMAAAFVHALDGESVDMWIEGHGRGGPLVDLDLGRTVGWLTALYPVRLGRGARFSDTLRLTSDTLAAVPGEGVGYGLLRWLAPEDARASVAAPRGPVFNYLGRFDASLSRDAFFHVAPEGAGAERDPQAPFLEPMRLDARILDGALRLDWTFDPSLYDEAAAQTVAAAFEAALREAAGEPGRPRPVALTPMQEGLLFQALLAPQDQAYVNLLAVTLEDLDVERFRNAWRETIARHEALRLVFRRDDGEAARAFALDDAQPLFEEHDWRGQDDVDARLLRLGEAERKRGFDLSAAPPMRFVLVRIDEKRWRFLFVRHHVLLDGWSTARILNEVADASAGLREPAAPTRVRDHLAGRDRAADEAFWRDALKDVAEPFRLPSRSASDETRGRLVLRLPAQPLREGAREARVTLNTLVQGAFGLLLQRRSLQRRAIFGVTVAGRPEDALDAVGLFINTLPVVVEARPDLSTRDFLAALQAQNAAMREHQRAPLYDVQSWAAFSGEPLFDAALVFENYPVDGTRAGAFYRDPLVDEDTHYPLSLTVEAGEEIVLTFGYARAQFSDAEAAALADQFARVLTRLAEDVERPLGRVGLAGSGAGEIGAPAQGFIPVHEEIARRAAETPDAVAVRGPRGTLSYAALEARANAIAARLARLGVGREARVGVFLERDADMAATLVAIFKASAAYVPLDPDYPESRLAFMAADAGLAALVTQESLRAKAPAGGFAVLALEDVGEAAAPSASPTLRGDDLAYVIYTSGSTGRPKGVMIPHAALANLLASMAEAPGLARDDRMVALTSLSFDISALELLLPLTRGAQLRIASREETADARRLAALLDEAGASVVQATPSGWRQLVDGGWKGRPSLKALCGGEALPPDLAEALVARGLELWNMYGPTETTIWSAAARVVPGEGAPPVAGPARATSLRVLDDALEPVPAGAAGELFIGGRGLARGYLGRPGLTAERFVPDPFGPPGARMYRSGDVMRVRSDGGFDYLCRADHQVKIRGHRIELGEVEAALAAHEGVRAAAAAPSPRGDALVAYVVAREGLDEETLVAHLAACSPAHMLPSRIVFLERLPLTPNGKLDRAALPRPEAAQASFAAPREGIERAVADIWSAVLGVPQVGRASHFFRLGGHSLSATRMIARIEVELGLIVPLKTIFDAPTLAGFAARLEALRPAEKAERLDALMAELGLS
ncbi:amino acid adenylation domain-containing protein [Methylocella sp.]|uniref:amino acid adenylation domain-containing protein n=2 Tax=Methylocella sp. TaxID=1978226 RepID=UPI0035AD7CB6